MKYLLFLIGSVCCFCVQLQGQHAFIPPSPNAASLGIYGDIPMSKYTGVPNISIPIYEINIDGYSLPIQLSYHASGIRVQQEASWVGLGWSLLAGGVITKNVRGKDDFRGGYMFTEEIPENKDQALEVLKEYLEKKGDSYSLTHDLNPDIYYYNISGYSGKFLISKTGKGILFTPQENLKIEWKSSSHNQSGVWEITDPNGIKYYFDDYEETHTHTSSDKSSFDVAATTAWYLSKIVLLNGQSIDFDYTNRQGPQFVESKSVEARNPVAGTSEGSCIGNAEYVFYEVCKTRAITQYERILKRITWPDGYIDFLLSTREDIEYLNQKIVSPSKLDEINIYANGEINTLIKKIGFSYSYFNENTVNDRNKYEYLRLRLDHLKISDQLYSFRYFLVDREEMPSKTTNGYDHWGYYNGQASTKLLPKYRDPKTGRVYDGADRESNDKAIIGSLSEIIYPTGGKINFSYQLNEYLSNDYTNVKGGGIRIAKIETASTTRHFSYENQTFSTGKLLSDPIYAYEELYIGRCTNANVFRELVLTRLSASCQPLTGFQHGNSVGYDQVTEFITDGERRSTIEEYFYNEKEEQSEYPFAPNKINLSNGLLKSRVIYSDWQPVKKEFYKYGKEKLPSVYAYASFGSTWCHYENPFEWWRLISKTTEQDDVTTLCEYSYNDQYLLSQELIQTSSPKIIKRIYKYPSDIISGSDLLVMENMRNKHILTPCIETLDYVVENNSSKLISGEYKEYKLFHSNLYLPHIVKKLKISTPIENNSNYSQYYEPVITYDYNTNGYVTGFCVKGDLETAIIWGYNGMYPVVKAQNAGMKSVVIKREITDKMTIDTNEKKRITIKHAGGDVTIQLKILGLLPSAKGTLRFDLKKTEGNQLIESGTLFQEYGFNGDPVYSNKPFIISNLAEGYYQLYLNADYNNNRICEISVNYLGFEENIKNLFYEGFEGFLSSEIQPFAGEGCCMGNYTVPFLKPDNQKYYVDYRTYGGGKWTYKKDIYTDNMRLYGQAIDEVRVYPENAQISSFTYKPLVGISSDTDPSGRTVFYIYDHFGRLQCVKDENGNILNDYQYNYKH